MGFHTFLLQFAVLGAPLVHMPTEQVTPNLYRGLDPKIKDIYQLHDRGIKTIVSLRTNSQFKKKKLCDKLGMNWYTIKTGVFLTPTFEQFDQFRAIVNNPAKQPCYMSCEVDMDRTLVYLAAYNMVDRHWTADQIREDFKKNHQKRWWPVFRKYQRVVEDYAASKTQPNDTSETVVSSE